jgi:hypothetical protein
MTTEIASTSGHTNDTHLVVLVNGLNGNDTNWNVVVRNLRAKAKEGIAILASRSNMSLKVLVILQHCIVHKTVSML